MRLSFGSRFHLVLPLLLALAAPAAATPVTVTSSDLPSCDPLAVPANVDELGNAGGFPLDEQIFATDSPAFAAACPATHAGTGVLVNMSNLTPTDFAEVWYVADPDTMITNVDGLVNGAPAFRIDGVGANTPLIAESIAFDGVFQTGETWVFIIDDYLNALGLAASDFLSVGAVGAGSPGPPSSGSIIAIAVPEPTTALLLACGLVGLGVRRRLH